LEEAEREAVQTRIRDNEKGSEIGSAILNPRVLDSTYNPPYLSRMLIIEEFTLLIKIF